MKIKVPYEMDLIMWLVTNMFYIISTLILVYLFIVLFGKRNTKPYNNTKSKIK